MRPSFVIATLCLLVAFANATTIIDPTNQFVVDVASYTGIPAATLVANKVVDDGMFPYTGLAHFQHHDSFAVNLDSPCQNPAMVTSLYVNHPHTDALCEGWNLHPFANGYSCDDFVFHRPGGGNCLDSHDVQGLSAWSLDTQAAWDMGGQASKVAVFPLIDHDPTTRERLEYTVLVGNDLTANCEVSAQCLNGWRKGLLEKVYTKGWVVDTVSPLDPIIDDFTTVWRATDSGTFRYALVVANFDGDHEIDAVLGMDQNGDSMEPSRTCPPNYSGPRCALITLPSAPASCAFTHPPLKTQDPPVLRTDSGLTGFLSSDKLQFTVQGSKRYTNAQFSFLGEDPAYHSRCSGQFFAFDNPTDPCSLFHRAVIDFENAYPHCGLTRDATSDPNHIIFRGEIQMDEWEPIDGDFRGHELTRLVHSVLPFFLLFPKTVSATHSINVYSPINNLAAIIKQFTARGVDANGVATADITLYTNVQYPFKLIDPVIFFNNRGDLTPQTIGIGPPPSAPTDGVCGDPATHGACANEWPIHMEAQNSPPICNYSGDWTIHFMAICQPSLGAACPLPLNTANNRNEQMVEVKYHLTSEDFCPKIIADIPVSATLQSYQSLSPSPVPAGGKNNFLIGATTFWRAIASSSVAEIVEVSTALVTALDEFQNLKTLWSPIISAIGINFQHTDYTRAGGTLPGISDHPTWNDFRFDLVASQFGVGEDLSASFVIGCKLNVVFKNTDPSGRPISRSYNFNFRPMVMPGAETTDSEVSATSAVSLRGADPAPSGLGASVGLSKTVVIALIAGGGALLVALTAIIIVVRRRAAKATQPTQSLAMEGVVASGGGSSQP